MGPKPAACGILGIDIERFSRPEWSDPVRLQLRARLYRLVDRALAQTGIVPTEVIRTDTGDGMWLLVDSQVPAIRLPHPLVTTVAALLVDDNRRSPAAQRLRLRVVAHSGRVLTDHNGHAGQALNLTARLLHASVGRAVLAAFPHAELVLLVSEQLHQRVVACGAPEIDPDGYQPVWVSEKETSTRAWLYLPGLERQPALARLPVLPTIAQPYAQDLNRVVESTEGSPDGWQTPGQSVAEGDEVRRRELLIYAGTLFGDLTLDWLVDDRGVSGVDALVAERVAWRLRRLGETMPPDQVSAALSRHASAIGYLSKQASKAAVRSDLLRVLAQTEAYGGYVAAFDLANERLATRRFHAAMRAADDSGDSVMSGIVCMRMADSALAVGRPRHAVEIAEAGMTLVRTDRSLQVALSTSMAQAYADLGQAAHAHATLDRAEQLVSHPDFGSSRWSRMNRSRFVGDYGLIAVRLGRLEEAAALLQEAIDWHPAGNAHRAVLTIGLATVRFQQGAPEHAATLAGQALGVITRLPSASRKAVFSALGPYFQRYGHVPAVAELTSQLSVLDRVPAQ